MISFTDSFYLQDSNLFSYVKKPSELEKLVLTRGYIPSRLIKIVPIGRLESIKDFEFLCKYKGTDVTHTIKVYNGRVYCLSKCANTLYVPIGFGIKRERINIKYREDLFKENYK